MIQEFFKNRTKILLLIGLSIGFCLNEARGQEKVSTAATPVPAVKKTPSPIDEYQSKLGKAMKTPAEFLAILAEFINKYNYSERAASYFSSVKTSIKYAKDKDEARNLLNQLVTNSEDLPSGAKVEIYRHLGEAFFINGFYEDSASLAQQAINNFDETAYLDFKRKQGELNNSEAIARNPKYNARPFDAERMNSFYIGQKTGAYNLLAKSLWEQGKFQAAEKAFRDSLAIKVSKESAIGIAKAAEKNGKEPDALKYATIAALTGKLVPDEMDYFYSLYAKQHNGKKDGVEEHLDMEFKKADHNPIKGEKYKKTDKRSNRTVLVEFVTGAGCVPCIPFDYTFEKVLEDYTAKDLFVIAYHTHAPTMDPLANNSADARYNYYKLNGAPNVFIDGEKYTKDSDGNTEVAKEKYQAIADSVNQKLRKSLEIPADAEIKLKAKRNGQRISVDVEADRFKNVSDDVTLQIALVEKEVTYSGENGLRFHLMVVRALAGDNDKRVFGFRIDPAKSNRFDYTFDVTQIAAQNLDYYSTKTDEMMREFLSRMPGGKIPEGINIDFKFNYQKNQIDLDNLAVAAFLQDNKTKKILQSSIISLGK